MQQSSNAWPSCRRHFDSWPQRFKQYPFNNCQYVAIHKHSIIIHLPLKINMWQYVAICSNMWQYSTKNISKVDKSGSTQILWILAHGYWGICCIVGLGIGHERSATWSMLSRWCGELLITAFIVRQSIVHRSHVKCWNGTKWNEMEWKGMKRIRFKVESWSATRKCFLGLLLS